MIWSPPRPAFFFTMKQIPLTKGQFAIVDDSEFNSLSKFRWHASGKKDNYYAARSDKSLMHRIIMNISETKVIVDHKNGNTLDNRKENLRVCNKAQNSMNKVLGKNNSCGWKGVSRLRKHGRWSASIALDKKKYHLGSFDTPEDAARAYNEAAIKLHGDFANLNQIQPLFPLNYRSVIRSDNLSGIKGVFFDKRTKSETWIAQIYVRGKQIYLGRFRTKEEAAAAYAAAAEKYHGEYANLGR